MNWYKNMSLDDPQVQLTLVSFVLGLIASGIFYYLNRRHTDTLYQQTNFPELQMGVPYIKVFREAHPAHYSSVLYIHVKNKSKTNPMTELEGFASLELKSNSRFGRSKLVSIKAKVGVDDLDAWQTDAFSCEALEKPLSEHMPQYIKRNKEHDLPPIATAYQYSKGLIVCLVFKIKYKSSLLDSKKRVHKMRVCIEPKLYEFEGKLFPEAWDILSIQTEAYWEK
jgi:hypothetical protein